MGCKPGRAPRRHPGPGARNTVSMRTGTPEQQAAIDAQLARLSKSIRDKTPMAEAALTTPQSPVNVEEPPSKESTNPLFEDDISNSYFWSDPKEMMPHITAEFGVCVYGLGVLCAQPSQVGDARVQHGRRLARRGKLQPIHIST